MLQWQRGWLLRLHICCPFWMAFRMGPLSMPTFLPLAHWRTTSSHLSMLSTRCASAGLDSPLAIPPSPALLLTYSRCSRRGRDRSPQALWRSHLLLWPLLLHPQPKPVKVCALQHSAGYSPGHHPVDPWILWRRRWQHVPVRAAGCVRGQAGAHTHTHTRAHCTAHSLIPRMTTHAAMGTNFVFYLWVGVVGYSWFSIAQGKTPTGVPVISEAANMQIGPY